jgi:hypothetical protein
MFKVSVSLALLIISVFVISLYDYHPSKLGGEAEKISHRDRMQTIVKRAVRIEYVCNMTNMGLMGSGVVIDKSENSTIVATAAHVATAVAAQGCDIVVRDWKGFSGYGKVVKFDDATDIATIEVGEPIGEVAPLYSGAYLGQAISCVGWPMIPYNVLDRVSITRGYVSTLDVNGFLRVSADLFYGNSGGACFSKNGSVVGIVSFFYGSDADGLFDLPTPRPGQFYISDVKNLKILLD